MDETAARAAASEAGVTLVPCSGCASGWKGVRQTLDPTHSLRLTAVTRPATGVSCATGRDETKPSRSQTFL